MNRLIAAIILTFLIAIISFSGFFLVNKQTNIVVKTLETTKSQIKAGDFKAAKQSALKADKQWTKAENSLSFFINRLTLYEIGVDIAKLPDLIESKDKAHILSQMQAVHVRIQHALKDEAFSFT